MLVAITMCMYVCIMQVLVPYLKAKLDNYHKALAEQLPQSVPRASPAQNEVDSSLTNDGSDNAVVPTIKSTVSVFLRRLKQLQLLYRLKKAFVKTYPFAHFAYEGTFFLYQVSKSTTLVVLQCVVWRVCDSLNCMMSLVLFLCCQWLYLFGDTPYFSPFLRRMKIILVRVTADDEVPKASHFSHSVHARNI